MNNHANLDSLEEAGMKYFRFVATLDKRTSPACRAHDGKVYKVADAAQGSNVPPLHPHCRSVISGYIEGMDLSKRTRIARDENGKNIWIPADMTYYDWEAVYIKKTKTLKEWKNEKKQGKVSKSTGGRNSKIDSVEEYFKQEKIAKEMYREIRKDKIDIVNIAKNTGFSIRFISEVKNHVFYDKHKLDDGIGLFDADIDIATSWQRLNEGSFDEIDILLIRHEHLEWALEKRYNFRYKDAHERANRKYNWEKVVKGTE